MPPKKNVRTLVGQGKDKMEVEPAVRLPPSTPQGISLRNMQSCYCWLNTAEFRLGYYWRLTRRPTRIGTCLGVVKRVQGKAYLVMTNMFCCTAWRPGLTELWRLGKMLFCLLYV